MHCKKSKSGKKKQIKNVIQQKMFKKKTIKQSFIKIIFKKNALSTKSKNINFKNIDETSFLFEDWLKDSSLIKKPKINKKYIIENIKKSTQDNNDLTTETLAKTYIEQGHYERAIQAYQILSLKYPKKSGFFANQIKNIENILK